MNCDVFGCFSHLQVCVLCVFISWLFCLTVLSFKVSFVPVKCLIVLTCFCKSQESVAPTRSGTGGRRGYDAEQSWLLNFKIYVQLFESVP